MNIALETPGSATGTIGLQEWLSWAVATRGPRPREVEVANDDDVRDLAPHLPGLHRIVLQFPKWTDGRAYSQARLLRGRLRFGGQLLARGAVLVDMLPLLQRCGFDAAELRADQDVLAARRALRLIDAHYQADCVDPRPQHMRRRQTLEART